MDDVIIHAAGLAVAAYIDLSYAVIVSGSGLRVILEQVVECSAPVIILTEVDGDLISALVCYRFPVSAAGILCTVQSYGHIFRNSVSVFYAPYLLYIDAGELSIGEVVTVLVSQAVAVRYRFLNAVNVFYAVFVILRQVLIAICPVVAMFSTPFRSYSGDSFFFSICSRLAEKSQRELIRTSAVAVVYPGLCSCHFGGAGEPVGQVITILAHLVGIAGLYCAAFWLRLSFLYTVGVDISCVISQRQVDIAVCPQVTVLCPLRRSLNFFSGPAVYAAIKSEVQVIRPGPVSIAVIQPGLGAGNGYRSDIGDYEAIFFGSSVADDVIIHAAGLAFSAAYIDLSYTVIVSGSGLRIILEQIIKCSLPSAFVTQIDGHLISVFICHRLHLSSVGFFCAVQSYGHIFRKFFSIIYSPYLLYIDACQLRIGKVITALVSQAVAVRYRFLNAVNVFYAVFVILRQVLIAICPGVAVGSAPYRSYTCHSLFFTVFPCLAGKGQAEFVRSSAVFIVYPGLCSCHFRCAGEPVGKVISVFDLSVGISRFSGYDRYAFCYCICIYLSIFIGIRQFGVRIRPDIRVFRFCPCRFSIDFFLGDAVYTPCQGQSYIARTCSIQIAVICPGFGAVDIYALYIADSSSK